MRIKEPTTDKVCTQCGQRCIMVPARCPVGMVGCLVAHYSPVPACACRPPPEENDAKVGEPTEGDWKVGRNTRGQWNVWTDDPFGTDVTPGLSEGLGMTLADATLCAASKKLLEACKMATNAVLLYRLIDENGEPFGHTLRAKEQLDAAIALVTQDPPAVLLQPPASEQSPPQERPSPPEPGRDKPQ